VAQYSAAREGFSVTNITGNFAIETNAKIAGDDFCRKAFVGVTQHVRRALLRHPQTTYSRHMLNNVWDLVAASP
jgi:hypothetical protein